jgi:hypothetical protein
MKVNVLGARISAKLCLLPLLVAVFAISCGRKKNESQELPSGRYLQPNLPTTPPQAKSLTEEVEIEIGQKLQTGFGKLLSSSQARTIEATDRTLLVAALSASFGQKMTYLVGGAGRSSCVAAADRMSPYLSCLFFEVVDRNFKSEADVRKWLQSLVDTQTVSGAPLASNADVERLLGSAPQVLTVLFSQQEALEEIVQELSRSLESAMRAIEILASKQASLDLPYLGESFINGREFVLTTSLQQSSVGTSRVFNLESMVVKFLINNGRLVVIRPGEGLYSSSSQEDLIVAAYPITRTVTASNSREKFYQVDFSRPENKSFLVSSFGAGGEPGLQLNADVIVPRVAHAAKAPEAGMNNGLYFNQSDASLVLDHLVLIESSDAVLGDDDDSGEDGLGKDSLRPTVHLVQGYFPITEENSVFAAKHALPIDMAQMELRSRGVNDQTAGKDVPYFTSSANYLSSGGRARELINYARKFNPEKDITFVISRSVPEKVVPTIKSAVLSYDELFISLASDGKRAPRIRAVTQSEFEAQNSSSGLALGGSISAADPRVNMIYWDDSFQIGSAWATAASNPRSGEVISGDVMMTGSMWAMEGCKSYFARTWQRDKEPNLPKRPAGTVPSPMSRFLWNAKCEAALSNLGIFSKRLPVEGEPTPTSLAAFDEANKKGDLAKLAAIASSYLGRTVDASEMVAGSIQRSQHAALDPRAFALPELKRFLAADTSKLAADRTVEMETLLNPKRLNGNSYSGQLGQNRFTAHLDCVRNHLTEGELAISESGAPAITSQFVNSPEEGALSLVRSVVIHELGHVFGLRHNFIASTKPSVLDAEAKVPLAINEFTDSVMDYNDYGIDMGLGAMKDYTSPEGAAGLPSFGVYDVVALASLYMIPSEGIKFKSQPAFCTDRNVSGLGNCQRFDYGKDFNEFTLHRANVILQRLRYANPLDAVLDPRAPAVYAQLVKSLGQEMQKLTVLWAIAQDGLASSSEFKQKAVFARLAELGFRGQGAQQDFLIKFPGYFGVRPLGVVDAMKLDSSFFASPEYGAIISDMIRRDVGLSVVAVSGLLQKQAQSKGSDDAFTGVIKNSSVGDQQFNYLNELISYFSQKIVVPQGSAVDFEFFDDGQRRSAADATLDGLPYIYKLSAPLFNHRGYAFAEPRVSLDGPAPGSRKLVTVVVRGTNSIEDMAFSVEALKALALENPEHPAIYRLADSAVQLNALLEEGVCRTDESGVKKCESLRPENRAPALIILNSILSAVQGALPTTTVATGESAF